LLEGLCRFSVPGSNEENHVLLFNITKKQIFIIHVIVVLSLLSEGKKGRLFVYQK